MIAGMLGKWWPAVYQDGSETGGFCPAWPLTTLPSFFSAVYSLLMLWLSLDSQLSSLLQQITSYFSSCYLLGADRRRSQHSKENFPKGITIFNVRRKAVSLSTSLQPFRAPSGKKRWNSSFHQVWIHQKQTTEREIPLMLLSRFSLVQYKTILSSKTIFFSHNKVLEFQSYIL